MKNLSQQTWAVTLADGTARELAPGRSIRIEAGMKRPVPYTLAALAENFGAATFRFVVLGAIGVGLGLALTGIAPVRPEALPALALGALLGCLMGVVFQIGRAHV